LALDDDNFRLTARLHPEVEPLRQLRVSLSQIRQAMPRCPKCICKRLCGCPFISHRRFSIHSSLAGIAASKATRTICAGELGAQRNNHLEASFWHRPKSPATGALGGRD